MKTIHFEDGNAQLTNLKLIVAAVNLVSETARELQTSRNEDRWGVADAGAPSADDFGALVAFHERAVEGFPE